MPEIYVFGGCNGSGKTTLAITFLSALPGVEFVNADIIAADLNPQDVDAVAIQASRLMLERLKALSARNVDFAFESTHQAKLGKSSKTSTAFGTEYSFLKHVETICADALRC